MNVTANSSCCDSDNNLTIDNGTSSVSSSPSSPATGIPDSFYVTVGYMYIPGFIVNTIALLIIKKDLQLVQIPTNILLFFVCFTDLVALANSLIWHLVRYLSADVTSEHVCGLKSILGLFFPMYSGINAVFMAFDRYIALCMPFYYKSTITHRTWLLAMFFAAIALLLICCFPVMGMGTIWSVRGRRRACTTIAYHTIPHQRVFGFLYSSIGLLLVVAIFVANVSVVYTAIKLHRKFKNMATQTKDAPTPENQQMSCEIQFAKLVGALTIVFVVCWTPYNVSFYPKYSVCCYRYKHVFI